MAQKGLMKFLSRKDGKNTVSNNKDNEKAKLTRVLEFVQARKPEQAKLGEVVRFMYYPGDGTAAYWMQGMLAHRLDKYKVAKASNFTRNRFKVKQLKVVTCWGVRGEIPETVTVNLSRNTVWSLGTETLVTTEEDEVITFEEGETCETSDEVDETTDEASADDETTTSNRLVIEPNINESDSESLARIKLENNDDREDASTVISTISDDVSEVRRLRTMDMNEYLTDERAQEVIEKVSRILEQEDDIHARQDILRRICDTIGAAQEG